ncbi:hypothetical protein HJC23_006976 [Cyclotella cryptica]|uniref:MCP methyltransferase CheR-type SAM-binding domain-containing protein n=1 Tax=Cyclotella cryptica TaxID=29204 RepID=A0ABD3QP17_9STRA|eukprot:CCRYP_015648-RA/>CCRYP_015648-RA protein AED:0.19 eAED:-0.30 QI:0/-1/0/1/-1/1/1/0/345
MPRGFRKNVIFNRDRERSKYSSYNVYRQITQLIFACGCVLALSQLLTYGNHPYYKLENVVQNSNERGLESIPASNGADSVRSKTIAKIDHPPPVEAHLVEAPDKTTPVEGAPIEAVRNDTDSDMIISKAMQVSHATNMNRYPDEYLAVKEFLRKRSSSGNKVKILSFGSSYGDEAISLAALYFNEEEGFPDVAIYGYDIDEETLNSAKENVARRGKPLPIHFFDGRKTPLNIDGKYDAIFANSVLCDATSDPLTLAAVEAHFPFQDFEASLSKLDAALSDGGVLAIVNSSYNFADSTLAKRYEVVAQCSGDFVPRIDHKRHEFISNHENSKKDCVWMKKRSVDFL